MGLSVGEVSGGGAGTVRRVWIIRSAVATVVMSLALVLGGAGYASASASALGPSAVGSSGSDDVDDQVKAAKEYAGRDGKFYARRILVERSNDKMEWMALVVVRKPGEPTALIDPDGKVYTGGIDDFRANNELLTEDDKIVVPRDITSIDKKDVDLVTLSGHTDPHRLWWLVGKIAACVVVFGAAGLFFLRSAHRRRPDSGSDDAPPSGDGDGPLVADSDAAEPDADPRT
ncbi:hypothetical protein OHB04_24445 [Streptomyces sp. NBC_01775]|uniref:hypothetical protein n=1 Tax=Streptomyces sp. NBC_01775 TaxID=2975939 RepID=UPI002DD8B589|nr:hypothetical protein [Streptomyces sp. NBC_01775]WSB78601.1 hypothetical protein OHB04_24445 [Streptomyces sp. NBC_01775]